MKSDLKRLSRDNILVKFAENITFIVPEHSTVDTATELRHTQVWAADNMLCLNTKKTRDFTASAEGWKVF